ncbi:hypothetical protein B0H34DRAFT_731266 [Crassisporium funariophilum]|nr:hypothetical protein B0H34DRAFT_731266 [Crassisporium funariophilum]
MFTSPRPLIMSKLFFLFLISFCLLVDAQTVTTTNAAGLTVIQVVTTVAGTPTTQVIQTISTPPSTAATTSDDKGPVAQPPATTGTPGGPTPYTYTTVINGVTNVLTDVFTPTSPATVTVTAGASGTVLDYSSWLSIYGPTHTPKTGAADTLKSCFHFRIASIAAILLTTIMGGVMVY